MGIVIPRICEGCGKEFVRRGRTHFCEECKPPGTKTQSKRTPANVGKKDDIAYTTEFFRDALATLAVPMVPVSKHDAAVIFNAAKVLPPHIGRVMQQDAQAAEKLANVARRGAFIMLGVVLAATVVMPIAANHLPFVSDKMKMQDDAVDETVNNMMSELAKMMSQPVEDTAPVEPSDNSNPDLDLSFLESPSSEAA